MKTNRIQKGVAALLAVIMCLAFMPISADEARAEETSLLEENSIEMVLGNYNLEAQTVSLTSKAYFEDGYRITDVVSNNTNIATVSREEVADSAVLITAVDAGETDVVLTIELDGEIRTEKVAVKVSYPPFSVNEDEIVFDGMIPDEDYCQLYYNGSADYDNDIIKAESSDPDVATVEALPKDPEDGFDRLCYKVVATGIGTATITCTDKYGQTAYVPVTVNAPELQLDKTSIDMGPIEEYQSPARICNTNYKTDIAGASISDSSIASVKIVEDWGSSHCCEVTPLKPGKAVITITDKYGSTKKVNINIAFPPLELNIGNKVSFDKYTGEDGLANYVRYSGQYKNDLATVVSKDPSIVKVITRKYGGRTEFNLRPQKAGTTTVVVTDIYGTKKEIQVTVTQRFIDGMKYSDDLEPVINNLYYGDKVVLYVPNSKAIVTAAVNGKTYKAQKISKGWLEIAIPLCRIGTPVTITSSYRLATVTTTVKVKNNKPTIVINKVKSSSRKVTGYVKDVHKGDKVIIKVGRKTYTKKVTKNKSKFKYSVKIKKQKKKTKIKVTVKNKFKQKLRTKTIRVK